MVQFDLNSSTLIPFVSNKSQIGCVTLWRGQRQGEMAKESGDFLHRFIPHLEAALVLSQALQSARERALRAEAALGASPTAVVLLSADGHLTYMNEAAERLTRGQDGIRVQRNRLAACDPLRQNRLDALISFAAAASGAAFAQPGGAITLPRASGKRPLQALVSPLRLAKQPGQSPSAHVLIFITYPEASVDLPREILSVLYDLISSEVEVANGLLAGLSLEQIAAIREVSRGTVRTQIKSLLHKTGTRRQSDLIRLLLSLPKTVPIEN